MLGTGLDEILLRHHAIAYNETLFITGGEYKINSVWFDNMSQFVYPDGTITDGPTLPQGRRDHCSVKLHDDR